MLKFTTPLVGFGYINIGKACNKCYAEIILPARFELPQFKTNLKKVKK